MQLFLAAPLTQTLTKSGRVDSDFRRQLAALHSVLEGIGHKVFSAHVREKWGAALDTPSGALAIDLAQIDMCDALIAILGNPPSPGVQLELGYAIARKKPMAMVADPVAPAPYLVEGIPALGCAEIFHAARLDETYEPLERFIGGLQFGSPTAGAPPRRK